MSLTKAQAIRKIRGAMGDDDTSPDEQGYRMTATMARLIYQLAEAGILQVKVPRDGGPPVIRVRAVVSVGPAPFPASNDPVFEA